MPALKVAAAGETNTDHTVLDQVDHAIVGKCDVQATKVVVDLNVSFFLSVILYL